ncbi:hypothetical protein GOP47_0011700, partial [Adiantum capillus-veneris]
MHILYAH